MNTKHFEEKISAELKWNKIDDIPDFPCSNFNEVKQKIKENIFSIGIDFTTANQLAQWLYGKGFSIFFTMHATTPIIVAILGVNLAFALAN
ncbi:MAG: hypothetical protein Q8P82_00630 [bacterium]|nr:hypothetical protein [bacterium]